MSNQPEALRLADALESGTYLLSRERDATAAELRRQHAEIELLKAERDVLRADSERYRWLFCHDDKTARVNSVWRLWDGQSDWGAAIDAAREKK